jgi:hypothetical protein
MDTLTDILSTFFVSKREHREHREQREQIEHREHREQREHSPKKKEQETDTDTFSSTEGISEEQTDTNTIETSTNETDTTDLDIEQTSITFCDIKADELYRKKVIVFNRNIKDRVQILCDVLVSLSSLDNVKTLYNKKMYIHTSKSNKTHFTKMILENPEIYFEIEFVWSNETQHNTAQTNEKKTIYAIDTCGLPNCVIEHTVNENKFIQSIVLTSDTFIISNMMNDIRNNRAILIHKNEKTETSYNRFWKEVVLKVMGGDTTYEEYIKTIKRTFALRYFIIVDRRVQYK